MKVRTAFPKKLNVPEHLILPNIKPLALKTTIVNDLGTMKDTERRNVSIGTSRKAGAG